MDWLVIVLAIFVFCFGFVLMFGAPYVPTLNKQVKISLDLLDLTPGQTMLELGSGDGRVLKAAADRGWRVVGYELNPILLIISRLRTYRYGSRVQVRWGNFWTQDWPKCDGIYTFLLGGRMEKLDQKILMSQKPPLKLTSFAFQIPGKKPSKEIQGIYLYEYK